MKRASFIQSRRYLALAVVVALLSVALSGCAEEQQTGSAEDQASVTYADLTESEQNVIDLIYDNKNSWMHIYNSIYDYYCVYVGFTSYGDDYKCVFFTRNKSSTQSSNGWEVRYFFDTETGEFECLKSTYVAGMDAFGFWTEDYRILGAGELKDALAAKYISYLDSSGERE